jgi:hypothetical protein
MRTGFVNLTASDGLTSNGQLGELFEVNGATWMYVKASGAIAQYDAVVITNKTCLASSLTTTLATSTNPQCIGIAQFAFADAEYGWVAVGPFVLREDGVTEFLVNNGNSPSAASVKLYSHATAGRISDQTAASAVLIPGLVFSATATTAGTAYGVTATRKLSVNNS